MTLRISSVCSPSRVAKAILLASLGASLLPNAASASEAHWRYKERSFICTGLKLDPPEKHEVDPVYRIDISLEVDSQNRVVSISVTHMTVFGRTFQRTDQYPIVSVENPDTSSDLMWTGRYRKDPSIILTSLIDQPPNNGLWFYHEAQFKNGEQRMNLSAGCSAS